MRAARCDDASMGLIITTDELADRLGEPGLVVADVRWNPSPPPSGADQFAAGHVPGAVYLDLDDDLSDRGDLSLGRHPLPTAEEFVERLARAGIGRGSSVVCCDEMCGALASRLWWMLRHWLGHEDVALLDGGLGKWRSEGREIETGVSAVRETAGDPIAAEIRDAALDLSGAKLHLAGGGVMLDARSPERYRGAVEPLDTKAGHIPGATNRWLEGNLVRSAGDEPVGVFKGSAALRRELAEFEGADVASSCGSGVTGCHNILAFELAGLAVPRLYVGSWSEWLQHEPGATGDE